MTTAPERSLPFTGFLAGPRELLEPLRNTEEFRRYAAQNELQLIHGPMLGSLIETSFRFWVRTVGEVPVRVLWVAWETKRTPGESVAFPILRAPHGSMNYAFEIWPEQRVARRFC